MSKRVRSYELASTNGTTEVTSRPDGSWTNARGRVLMTNDYLAGWHPVVGDLSETGGGYYLVRPEEVAVRPSRHMFPWRVIRETTPVHGGVVLDLTLLARAWAHATCEGGLPVGEAWAQVVRMPQAARHLHGALYPTQRELDEGMEMAGWRRSGSFYVRG